MERKTVKPIISRKHMWKKDEYGEVDTYGLGGKL